MPPHAISSVRNSVGKLRETLYLPRALFAATLYFLTESHACVALARQRDAGRKRRLAPMARLVRMPLMRVGEQHPGDIERIETNCATGPRAGRGIVWGGRHERAHPHAKRVYEDNMGRDRPCNLVVTLIHQAGRYMRRLQEMLTPFRR